MNIGHDPPSQLNVTLIAPNGKAVRLRTATWGAGDTHRSDYNIVTTYTTAAMAGVPPNGTWRLQVQDVKYESYDRYSGIGYISSFGLRF